MINANFYTAQRFRGASTADGSDAGGNGDETRDAQEETTRDKTRRLRQFELPPIAQEEDSEAEDLGTAEEG